MSIILSISLVLSQVTVLNVYSLEESNIEEKQNEYQLSEIINIPDTNLKVLINKQLKKSDWGSDITKSELEKLEYLHLYEDGIESLEGIQYCSNLVSIYSYGNPLKDISSISKLTNLEELTLYSSNISDISALSNTPNLKVLNLDNNGISDISKLHSLPNLETLSVTFNRISSINELKNFPKLKKLYLNGNEISSIDETINLQNLELLDLSFNKIKNINKLKNLTKLKELYLGSNEISDISILSNLLNLVNIALDNNKITNIDVFSKINTCNYLWLSNNKITDITPLQNLNINYELLGDYNPCIDLDKNYLSLNFNKDENNKVIDKLANRGYTVSIKNQLKPPKVFTNFTVNSLNNKSTIISGTGEPGAIVNAIVGDKVIGGQTIGSSGKYSIKIPQQKVNTKINVEIYKNGYDTCIKSIIVSGVTFNAKKSLTKDIYKYDAGTGRYLTYINGKGYSQYIYLNTSGKYAFTPSSWMTAAGLSVSMPTSSNGYTMMIDNNYIEMCKDANNLLNKIKSNRISKSDIEKELKLIDDMKNKSTNTDVMVSSRASIKKSLTKDVYKYDIGKGKYLTYINGKGYSQYSYLNTSGKYAFTPSSWMTAAGLTVTMPTSSNGYTMKITNPYITKYTNLVKQIEELI